MTPGRHDGHAKPPKLACRSPPNGGCPPGSALLDRDGHDPGVTHPPADAPSRRRWATALDAIAAVRATDPERVRELAAQFGGRSRWLTPLAYGAGTLAIVFDGVLLLLHEWRLILLQVVSAAWLWAAAWNLRSHILDSKNPPVTNATLIAVAAILVTQVAYWCNATFAFTLNQDRPIRIRPAFAAARVYWRQISGVALAVGALQAGTWLILPGVGMSWFWLAAAIIYALQLYMFVALPMWLLRVRKTGTRRDRTIRSLTTGVLSGIAAIPGFLLNRIGLLLMGIGPLWWVGLVIFSISIVVHVAASSSTRVVKMSVRLREAPPAA